MEQYEESLNNTCNFLDVRMNPDWIYDANHDALNVLGSFSDTVPKPMLDRVIIQALMLLVPTVGGDDETDEIFMELQQMPYDVFKNWLCPMGDVVEVTFKNIGVQLFVLDLG